MTPSAAFPPPAAPLVLGPRAASPCDRGCCRALLDERLDRNGLAARLGLQLLLAAGVLAHPRPRPVLQLLSAGGQCRRPPTPTLPLGTWYSKVFKLSIQR